MHYRGYIITTSENRHGAMETIIESPNGDAWATERDPRDEIDLLVDGEDSDYVKDNRMLQREFV